MKNIIIVTHCMEVGGAEKSLIELLDCVDYQKYAVDLFIYKHSGDFMNKINPNVMVLGEKDEYSALMKPIKDVLCSKKFYIGIVRIAAKLLSYIKCTQEGIWKDAYTLEYSHKLLRFVLPQINKNKKYDLAISFLTPHYIGAAKVVAKKRIAWIHTDYTSMNIDEKSELKMWDRYDYIAAISESSKQAFLNRFQKLKDKVIVIENILSSKSIRQQADKFEPVEMKKEGNITTICSVGRFAYPKNFDNVPNICKRIIEMGCNVKWYLIGFGGEEQKIRNEIQKEGMEEYVIVLGKKTNPYPYMKACDIYVQPSRYEGKSVTVREAQILGKPVIITNYKTAPSQVRDGIDGVIVPQDNEGCAKGIVEVIKNKDLQENLLSNLKKYDYGNESEVQKIYEIVGD